MNLVNTNITKNIDKKDYTKVLILIKNSMKDIIKKLKKGILTNDQDLLKIIIKKIKNKNNLLSNKTKENLLKIFEKSYENPIIVNKESKLYKKSLKDIEKKFSKLEKKDVIIKKNNYENENHILQYIKNINLMLKTNKLNKKEKDSLIFDFFISKGFNEIELKLAIYEIQVELLNKIIIFFKTLEKKI
jgi:CO dehydrogenase/acetyl-CoA synthase gamma subunit (corrinoid Fe-S protein)